MVASVRLGLSSLVLAIVGACSRMNPEYDGGEAAGDGGSDVADDKSSADDGPQGTDDDSTGGGSLGTDTKPVDDTLDTAEGESTAGPDVDTSDDAGEVSEGGEVSSTGNPLAEPDAVFLFGGPSFTGRIEHNGVLGYDAALDACTDTASIGTVECSERIVAVLGVGTPEERAVDFATFLGVVATTNVRGPNGMLITSDADEFFDGELDVSLFEAGVFSSPTHVWTGLDPNERYGNCEDWTDEGVSAVGGVGDAGYGSAWVATGNFSCSDFIPILCACW